MVGYDDTSDPPCFKLTNSWGESWGEDGYFRITQTEKGQYGLFGVVSHGVIPYRAMDVTAWVTYDIQDVPVEPWAWVLIILACILGCMCCVGVVKKMHDGNAEAEEKDNKESD
jgi:hypothetical protein